MRLLLLPTLYLCALISTSWTLSWGRSDKKTSRLPTSSILPTLSPPFAHPSRSEIENSRAFSAFASALTDLAALESEPICHRVAARLLVNHCQVLDGKDEATILTDSGRQIRDFVDSYAASLAICDLERGSFVIPQSCAKFRENILRNIPLGGGTPYLHVSSTEIDACLSGLAASDSAWTTWVSYRHKAMRFCELARADKEKDQKLLLYKRLTKVMEQLVNGIESELDKRVEDVESRIQRATDHLIHLSPELGQLKRDIHHAREQVARDLDHYFRQSAKTLHQSLQDGHTLQQLLASILRMANESTRELSASYESSLQKISYRVGREMSTVMDEVSLMVAASASLYEQTEASVLRASELSAKQDLLQQGLEKLVTLTQDLTEKFEDHAKSLSHANNITDNIMRTLDGVATSADRLTFALSSGMSSMSWWPYVLCPTVSLIMGSYGLPPSASRNLGLIALGEAMGFIISPSHHFKFNISPNHVLSRLVYFSNVTTSAKTNSTV